MSAGYILTITDGQDMQKRNRIRPVAVNCRRRTAQGSRDRSIPRAWLCPVADGRPFRWSTWRELEASPCPLSGAPCRYWPDSPSRRRFARWISRCRRCFAWRPL